MPWKDKEKKRAYNRRYRLENREQLNKKKILKYATMSQEDKEHLKRYGRECYLRRDTGKSEKTKEYMRRYRLENKDYLKKRSKEHYLENGGKEKSREYYLKNKEEMDRKNKRFRKETRLKVIEHYGGKCKCCGEDRIEFLAIDHINGDGTKERKKLKLSSGIPFYSYIIKNNYPDRYRLLCHNCNLSLGFYGYCPHQKGKNGELKFIGF